MQYPSKKVSCGKNGQIRLPQSFRETLSIDIGVFLNVFLLSKAIILTLGNDAQEDQGETGVVKTRIIVGSRYLITIPREFRVALGIENDTNINMHLIGTALVMSLKDNPLYELCNTIKELKEDGSFL